MHHPTVVVTQGQVPDSSKQIHPDQYILPTRSTNQFLRKRTCGAVHTNNITTKPDELMRPHPSAHVASDPYDTAATATTVGYPADEHSVVAAAIAAATGGVGASASAKNAASYAAAGAAAARPDRTSTGTSSSSHGGGGSGRRTTRTAAGGGVEDADGEVHRSELLVVNCRYLNHPPGAAATVLARDLEERSVGYSAHAEDRADHAAEIEKTRQGGLGVGSVHGRISEPLSVWCCGVPCAYLVDFKRVLPGATPPIETWRCRYLYLRRSGQFRVILPFQQKGHNRTRRVLPCCHHAKTCNRRNRYPHKAARHVPPPSWFRPNGKPRQSLLLILSLWTHLKVCWRNGSATRSKIVMNKTSSLRNPVTWLSRVLQSTRFPLTFAMAIGIGAVLNTLS